MGAYLSEPVTEKISEDGSMDRVTFGASSMQGWRISQEDSHNCIPEYDENTSFFAVYDGHGGAEVAQYCSSYLPNFIKSSSTYKAGNIAQALEDAFLDFDATLVKEDVLQHLKQLAGISNETEDSENEVNFLYEEAHMPLEELLARYHKSSIENQQLRNAKNDNKSQSPCIKAKPLSSTAEDLKAGPSCSFTDKKDPDEKEKEAKHVSENSDSVVCDSNLVPVNGSVDPVAEKSATDESSPTKNETKDEVPVVKSTNEVNGKLAKELDESTLSDASSSPEKGKGKGKGKGKSILGVAIAELGSKKDGEIKTPKRPPTRMGRHRQAKPVNMEDNSGDSQDSESDDEYKCAVEVSEPAEEEEDADNDGEANAENEAEEEDEDESEEESDDDDDDDEEEEDENDGSFTMSDKEEAGYDSGCTAVVALLRGDELYVANAGDSRCVVCRAGKAIEMSHDHKPEDELEMKRIVAAGGKVTSDGRVNGGLNLSRALGDHSYKKNITLDLRDQMISALPDIRTLTIDPEEDEFMVIACDGIWNFMNSQEVIDFVRDYMTPESSNLSSICEKLFDRCLAPTTVGDGTGCDNMTCIIVKFHHKKSDATKASKRSNDVSIGTTDSSNKRARTESETLKTSDQSQ